MAEGKQAVRCITAPSPRGSGPGAPRQAIVKSTTGLDEQPRSSVHSAHTRSVFYGVF